ncbi:MAG: RNA-directed DNA polymerase [Sinomicrobium sp.]|nr:RNA-directed DNA polymerase [Sinomicrobium sp.]
MKRVNDLMSLIAEMENLRLAFWKAGKGKRCKRNVLGYQQELEKQQLLLLQEQLLEGQVEVGDYRFFRIYDPKERQICAAAFREQVLHHALMNICHPYFEKVQIYDSYACRKGKGTYAALARARIFTTQYPWFLKLDIRKFFDTVHQDVLKQQLGRIFKEAHLLHIFGQIIDSYAVEAGRGLPIGNLTSQYFANHFLAGLDHYIKEELRIKAYVRYMDDLVLWHVERERLKKALDSIQEYTEQKLQVALKPPILNRTRCGLPFLGYRLLPTEVRLLHKSKRRFIRKAKQIEQQYDSGRWDEATCQRHLLPLLAFIRHADTKILRENVFLGQRCDHQ